MGCFVGGTQIQMHEGVKSIEDVEIGDIVKSFDVGTSSVIDSKVTKTYVHTDRYYMILNGTIKTTSVHPFYTDGKWIEAGDLSIGDKILHVDGLEHTIDSIEEGDEVVDVYNLEVGGIHNYFELAYESKGGEIELVVFDGMPHSFVRDPQPESDEAIEIMKTFISHQL